MLSLSVKSENIFTLTDRITGVAFSPDGRTLASCGYDQVIHLWSVDTGTLKDVFVG
ncbi:hypothetical protein J4G08_21970, partial [Candidatus Poribacteria bacterium]|nr:hypothetical protein [Candidatus Poribacteria bacterium]